MGTNGCGVKRCGLAVLLVLGLFAPVSADEAADQQARMMHVEAFSLFVQAMEAAQQQQWEQAAESHREALAYYRRLVEQFPEWQPDMVAERMGRIRLRLDELDRMREGRDVADPPAEADARAEEEREAWRLRVQALEARIEASDRARLEEIRERLAPVLAENERLREEIRRLEAAQGEDGIGEVTEVVALRQRLREHAAEEVRLGEQLAEAYERLKRVRALELEVEEAHRRRAAAEAAEKQLERQVREAERRAHQQLDQLRVVWQRRFEDLQRDAITRGDEHRDLLRRMEESLRRVVAERDALRQEIETLRRVDPSG